jgi:hypothetical protein
MYYSERPFFGVYKTLLMSLKHNLCNKYFFCNSDLIFYKKMTLKITSNLMNHKSFHTFYLPYINKKFSCCCSCSSRCCCRRTGAGSPCRCFCPPKSKWSSLDGTNGCLPSRPCRTRRRPCRCSSSISYFGCNLNHCPFEKKIV